MSASSCASTGGPQISLSPPAAMHDKAFHVTTQSCRCPPLPPLQVGPGAPATANQAQSYDAELTGATWKLEREVSHDLAQD